MPDDEVRTLAELAEAAVDASQSEERKLYIRPGEYRILLHERQDQVPGPGFGRIYSVWDEEVFKVAKRRDLPIPLPAVEVIVSYRRDPVLVDTIKVHFRKETDDGLG